MPTLTGLPALLKRVQVVATSAVAWLTAVSASLVVAAQLLDGIGGIPEWVTRGIASAVAVIAAVTLQVRRVTPVADADKGLLPPHGPAAEADPNRDVGLSFIEVVLIIVAAAVVLIAIKVF